MPHLSFSVSPGGESQYDIKMSFTAKGKKNWCISYFKIYRISLQNVKITNLYYQLHY